MSQFNCDELLFGSIKQINAKSAHWIINLLWKTKKDIKLISCLHAIADSRTMFAIKIDSLTDRGLFGASKKLKK